MASHRLKITNEINAGTIAQVALNSFESLSGETQELLLRSKNEQTFSGLLAAHIQREPNIESGAALVEIKGFNYLNAGSKSRNVHDIAVVNSSGESEILIENKVWYHFDGAKGKRKAKVERNVISQLKADIFKIKLTLKNLPTGARGFVIVHIVTPTDVNSIPNTYLQSHLGSFARVQGDWLKYRSEGMDGIRSVFEEFKVDLNFPVAEASNRGKSQGAEGALDILCVEVLA
jgi:hypothetical protein